mgnify:CR=1 FL=1
MQAGLSRTSGTFENLTRTTAKTAAKQFENALDRAYMQVSTGAFSTDAAIWQAVKDLSAQGVASIRYPSGRVDTLEAAVRRAVVTGVNQTAIQAALERARELGAESLKKRHVDGMVLMGSTFIEEKEQDNAYIRDVASGMPVVLLNGSYRCENVYCVLCDDQRATTDATQYLIDTGCKRILYLYHSKNYSGRKKLMGYRAGLASRGMAADELLIQFFADGKKSVDEVKEHLLALRDRGLTFDAELASEDILGVGAVKYARAVGKTPPEGLSIIGYNNSSLCLCCEPELTSVDNKLQAICDHCVHTMLGVLEGREMPQKTVFTGELVKRGSTL